MRKTEYSMLSTIFRVAAALGLLAASLPAGAASATATRAWQYKPESVQGLAVRNLIGDIRVERADVPGVHVTARTTVEAESEEEARRIAGLVEFRTPDKGALSRFEVRFPREHFPKIYWPDGADHWFMVSHANYLGERVRISGRRSGAVAVRVNLLIRAPAGAKLDVGNVFGDSEADRFSGELRLDGGSGTLRSTAGDGVLELDNGSGEVTVAGHRGRVSADTGSGGVTIADCECEIVADTGSGSVSVERGKGSVAADTGSGGVEIEDFAGPLAADTGSGSVRARGVSGVKRIDVDTGSGGVSIDGDLSALSELEIDTGSGSVNLRSSTQPSMEFLIDTGSGGVNVEAPGATVREHEDDTWTVRTGQGAGRGVIDTGSGGVDIDFQ
jgi:Putative adhesin